MAGSQPGAADWDTEENGPEFYSDFPEFDFSSSDPQFPTMSSPGFATSLELDAPLDNTATAPQDQESQFNLGEVDLDSMLDIFQFENQQEAGISRHPEPVPRDTPQNKPEKTDSELEEDEVTFELKKVDLLKRRRELGKLSQQEPGGQEKQIEKIREVDDELEGVELDLKTTRLRIRQKLIRKSRQSKLPQENQASSSLSTQVDPFRQSYSGGIDPSLLSTSAYNDNYYTKPPYSTNITQGGMDTMGQRYDQPVAGMDAPTINLPSSSVYQGSTSFYETASLYPPSFYGSNSIQIQTQPSLSGIVGYQSSVQCLPELPKSPAQPQSDVIPHKQSSNPTQATLASSIFQQELTSQHKMAGKTASTRPRSGKRPRSPGSIEAQTQSTFRKEVSTHAGAPESSLSVIRFGPAPPPERRRRTSPQRKNKKEVEEDGGSCFLCHWSKAKCSAHRPCKPCQKLYEDTCRRWRAASGTSTSPMWTCNSRTKLADFKIFNASPDEEFFASSRWARLRDAISSGEWDSHDAYTRKYGHLGQLLAFLGAEDDIGTIRTIGYNWNEIKYYGEFFRRRKALLYLNPELDAFLTFQDVQYRQICYEILKLSDWLPPSPGKSPGEPHVIIPTILYLWEIEIKRLRYLGELDLPSADHLRDILHTHMQVLCAKIFKPDQLDAIKHRELFLRCSVVAMSRDLSSCLPSGAADYIHKECKRIRRSGIEERQDELCPDSPTTSPEILSCLWNRSKLGPNSSPTPDCCCGWAFDKIPTSLLTFYGHSGPTFMCYVHCMPGPLHWVFTQLDMKEDNLPHNVALFRYGLSSTLGDSLDYIYENLAQGSYECQYQERDQMHSDWPKAHRQLLLFFAVQEAIFNYKKYRSSRGQNQVAFESMDHLRDDYQQQLRSDGLVYILDGLNILRQNGIPFAQDFGWDDRIAFLAVGYMNYKVDMGDAPFTKAELLESFGAVYTGEYCRGKQASELVG